MLPEWTSQQLGKHLRTCRYDVALSTEYTGVSTDHLNEACKRLETSNAFRYEHVNHLSVASMSDDSLVTAVRMYLPNAITQEVENRMALVRSLLDNLQQDLTNYSLANKGLREDLKKRGDHIKELEATEKGLRGDLMGRRRRVETLENIINNQNDIILNKED